MTNVSGAPFGDIWLEAVNTALGLPLDERRSTEPHANRSLDQMKRFIGKYESKEGNAVEISLTNSTLQAKIENKWLTLRAASEDVLVIINDNDEDFLKTVKPIRFYFHDSEKPWACRLGMRMLLRV